MQTPQVVTDKKALEAQGLDVATSSPDELRELMQHDWATAQRIVRKNNISVE